MTQACISQVHNAVYEEDALPFAAFDAILDASFHPVLVPGTQDIDPRPQAAHL